MIFKIRKYLTSLTAQPLTTWVPDPFGAKDFMWKGLPADMQCTGGPTQTFCCNDRNWLLCDVFQKQKTIICRKLRRGLLYVLNI